MTGHVFGSLLCDCQDQLKLGLEHVEEKLLVVLAKLPEKDEQLLVEGDLLLRVREAPHA